MPMKWKRGFLELAVLGMLVGQSHAAGAYEAPLPLASVPGVQAPAWKTYSYSADGFSASFPSEPRFKKKTSDNQAGTAEMRVYVVEDSATMLFIGISIYGDEAKGTDPDALLQLR